MKSVSIIIPGYNRLWPLRHTLRSAADALVRYGMSESEILLVDDGSSLPLAEQLSSDDFGRPIVHLRQANQGSIVARQTGLYAARGDWILFLDSDDLIPPEKFVSQLGSIPSHGCDIVYANMARARIEESGTIHYEPAEVLVDTQNPAEFFLCVQPAPHNPVYSRSYLLSRLAEPIVPAERRFDAAGDVWLYYNLCTQAARIHKVDASLAAAGVHAELRYSHHWEKLGVAALGIMEKFVERSPVNPSTLNARTIVGERAFVSWRGLPRRFDPTFTRRMLAVWQRSPRGPISQLGGGHFQRLARVFGPESAGRLLRLRNAPYDRVRTLDVAQFDTLFTEFHRS